MSETRFLLDQIAFARSYSLDLIDDFAPADWFRMPAEGVTDLAWQVGHLAFAQYRLALERVRGIRPEDATLIPGTFLTLFGYDSTPYADPARYPDPTEIRIVLDRVHEQVRCEVQELSAADLNGPLMKPHSRAKTKREVLLWCALHEMLHAGQIGLLRRLLGKAPRR